MEHAREQSPKAGKVTFGSYVLHDRIGAGGMAEIFLATKQAGQPGVGGRGGHGVERELVIKRILPSLSTDDQFVKMFVEEARLCVNLKHPNIVEVYDLGSVEAQYFIAMEYVHGRDLLKTLAACAKKRVAFPTDLALFIVMEVLKALDYAHNLRGVDGSPLGIIHRDVSPSNVLLSFDGRVKLGDFGIAKASTRERTATGILKGKFGYMAPEQVMARQIDHRADVFAVGILLYELLTGHRLFAGRNDLAVLERVRDAVIDPPPRFYRPDLSRELESIVLRALAREATQRFQSTSELHEALYNYTFKKGVVVTARTLSRFLHDLFLVDETEEHYGASAAKQNGVLGRASISSPERDVSGLRAVRGDTATDSRDEQEPAPGPRLVSFERGFDEESTENPDGFDDSPTTHGARGDSILPFPGSEQAKASFMLPTAPGDDADEEVEAHTDMIEGGGAIDPAELPRAAMRPSESARAQDPRELARSGPGEVIRPSDLPIAKPSARRVSLEPIPTAKPSGTLRPSGAASLSTTGKPTKTPRPSAASEVRALRKATAEAGETELDLEDERRKAEALEQIEALTPYGGVPVVNELESSASTLLEDVTVDAGSLGPDLLHAVRRALDGTEPHEVPGGDAERTDLLRDVGAQLAAELEPTSQPAQRTPTEELHEELDFVEIDGTAEELSDRTTPGDEEEPSTPEVWIEPTKDERTASGAAVARPAHGETTAVRAPDEEHTTRGAQAEWSEEVSLLQAESLLADDDPSRAVPQVLDDISGTTRRGSSVALRAVDRRHSGSTTGAQRPLSTTGAQRPLSTTGAQRPLSTTDAQRPLSTTGPTQSPVPADVAAAWSNIISKGVLPRESSSILTSPRDLAGRAVRGQLADDPDPPTESIDEGPPTEDIAVAAKVALAQPAPTPSVASAEDLPVARPRRAPSLSRAIRGASVRAEPRKRVATQVPLLVVNPPRAPSVMDEPANDETRMGALAGPTPGAPVEREDTSLGRLDAPVVGTSPVLVDRPRRESSGITAALSEAALVDAEIRAMRQPSQDGGLPIEEHTDNGELVDLERALGLDEHSKSTGPRPAVRPRKRFSSKAVALFADDVEETSNGARPLGAPLDDAGRLDDEGASDLFGALAVLDHEPSDLDLRSFDPAEEGSFETTANIDLEPDAAPSPVVRSSLDSPRPSAEALNLRGSVDMVRPVLDEGRYSGIIAPSVAAAMREQSGQQASPEVTNARGVPRDPAEEPSGIVMRFDEPTRPIQDGEAPVRAPRVDPLVMPRSDSDSISSSAIVDAQPEYRPQSYLLPKAPARLSSDSGLSTSSREPLERGETPHSADFMAASLDQPARAPARRAASAAPSERGVYEGAPAGGPALIDDDFDLDVGLQLASTGGPAVAVPAPKPAAASPKGASALSSPPAPKGASVAPAAPGGKKVSVTPARSSTPPSADSEGPSAAAARLRAVVERQRPAKEKLRTAELHVSVPPPAAAPTATGFFAPGPTDPVVAEPAREAPRGRASIPPGMTPAGAMTGPGVVPGYHNPTPRPQLLTTQRALWVLAAAVLVVGLTLVAIALRRPPATVARAPARGAAAPARTIAPVPQGGTPTSVVPASTRPAPSVAAPIIDDVRARPATPRPTEAAEAARASAADEEAGRARELERLTAAREEQERQDAERLEKLRAQDDARAQREAAAREAAQRAEASRPAPKPEPKAPAPKAEPEPRASAPRASVEPRASATPTPRAEPKAEPTPKAEPAPKAEPEAKAAAGGRRGTRPGTALKPGFGALRFDCKEPATVAIKPGNETYSDITKSDIPLKGGAYQFVITRANGSLKRGTTRVIPGSVAEVVCDQ